MRHLTKGFVSLAATAAILAPAGVAGANEQNGLVNVYAKDVATGNQVTVLQNVAIPVAANFCNNNVAVLSAQLAATKKGSCNATSINWQSAWVSYN
jgi:hypothetical protein